MHQGVSAFTSASAKFDVTPSPEESLEFRLFKPPPGFFVGECNAGHDGFRFSSYEGLFRGATSQEEAERAACQFSSRLSYGGGESTDVLNLFEEESEETESSAASESCCEMQALETSRRIWEKSLSDNPQTLTPRSGATVAHCVELFQRSSDVQ